MTGPPRPSLFNANPMQQGLGASPTATPRVGPTATPRVGPAVPEGFRHTPAEQRLLGKNSGQAPRGKWRGRWDKVVGKAPAASKWGGYAQKGFTKVLAPLHAVGQVASAGEQILSSEARKEAVDKYSTDLGTAGNVGRALSGGFFDPARAGSAFIQGVAQTPRAVVKSLFPSQYASPEQAKADEEARKEAAKGRRKKVLSVEEQLGGAPHEFIPSKFQQTKYALSPKVLTKGSAPEIVGKQKMGASQYFYGIPEVDKEKAMAYEHNVRQGEPRSWEEVKASREYRSDQELYWTDEERATYAELAKNNPDKLRSWFDSDSSGDISSSEKKQMMLGGFRAKLKGEAETAAADAAAADEAEIAAEEKAQRRWDREMYDFEGGILEEEAGRERKERKTARAEEKAQAKGERKAAKAEQLKKNRIAFAKGLESDLGYDDAPSSAFQNPKTRQRIMEEAFKRGKKLGVTEPQLRKFLRGKGLMDKGFSESYEDFHTRTTKGGGGGLRTGSVGARTTVGRGPKTETGGISTQAGRAAQAARNEAIQEAYRRQIEASNAQRRRYNPTQIPYFGVGAQ